MTTVFIAPSNLFKNSVGDRRLFLKKKIETIVM